MNTIHIHNYAVTTNNCTVIIRAHLRKHAELYFQKNYPGYTVYAYDGVVNSSPIDEVKEIHIQDNGQWVDRHEIILTEDYKYLLQ